MNNLATSLISSPFLIHLWLCETTQIPMQSHVRHPSTLKADYMLLPYFQISLSMWKCSFLYYDSLISLRGFGERLCKMFFENQSRLRQLDISCQYVYRLQWISLHLCGMIALLEIMLILHQYIIFQPCGS